MYKDIKTRYFYHAMYNSIMYGIYASFNHGYLKSYKNACVQNIKSIFINNMFNGFFILDLVHDFNFMVSM